MRTILRNEMSTRRLEFVSLLSVNGTVLVNAGSKNRSLEAFDPSGVISKMVRLPKAGQIRTSKVGYSNLRAAEAFGCRALV